MKYDEITALIADDEAHMRTFLKLMLTDLGIKKIYLMQNGMDAVEAFLEYRPHLVLLDINMALMNGLEALERIHEIDPAVIIVMMTAVSTQAAVEESSRKGATYYILKTQPPEEIKSNIRQVIDARVACRV